MPWETPDLSQAEIEQKIKEYNGQINSNLFMSLVSWQPGKGCGEGRGPLGARCPKGHSARYCGWARQRLMYLQPGPWTGSAPSVPLP